jgi:predicted short-subunit dehydrogenase-like oxidoreductase (DUF2520 family)
MKIGFIGAGKIGFTLGRYFAEKGVFIAGYYSRTVSSALEASNFAGGRAYVKVSHLLGASDCDVLILTVPDMEIPKVWDDIRGLNLNGKCVCHCSGSLSSKIFDGIENTGAGAFSLHPLFAANDKYHSWEGMDDVSFTIEGGDICRDTMMELLEKIGNSWSWIDADKKILYHAACVMFSNLSVGLAAVGSDLLEKCGLDNDFVSKAWHTLFLRSANAICSDGIQHALTGPVERNDADTVNGHIKALVQLGDDALTIYRELSKIILKVAEQKHPERDYSAVREELEG